MRNIRALVLSGGGALGAYEAGVISVLAVREGPFQLVCGTSIGALNAAFLAQDDIDALVSTWQTISARNVITYIPLVKKMQALIGSLKQLDQGFGINSLSSIIAALKDALAIRKIPDVFETLGAIDPTAIESILSSKLNFSRLKRALIVAGTNLTDGSSDAFYWFPNPADGEAFAKKHDKGTARALDAGNYQEAVRASTSIPFAFAPVTVTSGEVDLVYVDGGVANNTPIGVAIDAGADDITIVFLNPVSNSTAQSMPNLAAIGLQCFSIMQQRILDLDFANAKRVNAAIQDQHGGNGSSGERRLVRLREIRPATSLPISVLQFDKQNLIDETFARGANDAARSLS